MSEKPRDEDDEEGAHNVTIADFQRKTVLHKGPPKPEDIKEIRSLIKDFRERFAATAGSSCEKLHDNYQEYLRLLKNRDFNVENYRQYVKTGLCLAVKDDEMKLYEALKKNEQAWNEELTGFLLDVGFWQEMFESMRQYLVTATSPEDVDLKNLVGSCVEALAFAVPGTPVQLSRHEIIKIVQNIAGKTVTLFPL